MRFHFSSRNINDNQLTKKIMTQESLAKVKGICDIVFLVDISGSMKPCLDGLVDNINNFVNTLQEGADPNTPAVISDWRIKVCGYRDYESDGDLWWVEHPFVANDVETVKTNLKSLEAKGGGDEPECLLDGLWKVASMEATEKGAEVDPEKWRHRHAATRIVIIFTDATYKPTCFIPEATGATLEDVINKVTEMKLKICAFVPEGQQCYYDLGEIDKCELEEIEGAIGDVQMMVDYTSNKEHFTKVMEQLAKTVSKSSEGGAVVA
jgi:hypothetical protein